MSNNDYQEKSNLYPLNPPCDFCLKTNKPCRFSNVDFYSNEKSEPSIDVYQTNKSERLLMAPYTTIPPVFPFIGSLFVDSFESFLKVRHVSGASIEGQFPFSYNNEFITTKSIKVFIEKWTDSNKFDYTNTDGLIGNYNWKFSLPSQVL